MNSKQKGKRGELEFSRLCRDHGYDVRRTAQYCGNTGDAADVVGLDGIHVEVKRCEQVRLGDWMDQAVRDAKDGKLPIIAHRKNDCPWMITMLADGWFRLYSAWDGAIEILKKRVEYAEGRLKESAANDDDCAASYWRGYRDGLKSWERELT